MTNGAVALTSGSLLFREQPFIEAFSLVGDREAFHRAPRDTGTSRPRAEPWERPGKGEDARVSRSEKGREAWPRSLNRVFIR